MIVQELFGSLLQVLAPNLCTVCNAPVQSDAIMCPHCMYELPKTRAHDDKYNKTSNMLAGRIPFIKATSLFYYSSGSFFTRPIFHLKYYKKKHIGVELGKMLGSELCNSSFLESIDLILPVPLHKSKLKQRGYNQCSLIAQGLGDISQISVDENILFRILPGTTQTRKNRTNRWEHLQHAFIAQNTKAIENKHILIIDDVITTGATIEACANAILRESPTTRISIASIGVTA